MNVWMSLFEGFDSFLVGSRRVLTVSPYDGNFFTRGIAIISFPLFAVPLSLPPEEEQADRMRAKANTKTNRKLILFILKVSPLKFVKSFSK